LNLENAKIALHGLAVSLHIPIGNNLIASGLNRNIRKEQPGKTRRRFDVAILLIVAPRFVLPLFLPQGFIAVVALLKVGVANTLVPLFRCSVSPQEKEPPDSFF
jgi:hypothetical protein